MMQNWLLPEYIQDMLPEEAWRVEQIRSQLLALLRNAGYQLVAPPLLEYAESLLIDGSDDMDLRSFKVVDQLSGRTLALRADITPQVARIDAHLLNRQGVTRLCYIGSVLHTQPIGLTRTRELLQLGAEIYGHSGLDSDLEIQQLMLQSLALIGVDNVHLDLGHVGVFRALVQHAELNSELEKELFTALQGKDSATLKTLTASLDSCVRDALLVLPTLYGDSTEVLARARKQFSDYTNVIRALEDLQTAVQKMQPLASSIGIDLADLRGYHYHSGMVFAAYHAGSDDPIALGGRYDDLGKSFGRTRAATGFSMDLRQLYRLLPQQKQQLSIRAPNIEDVDLNTKIAELRAKNEVVIVDFSGEENIPDGSQYNRELKLCNGVWQVVAL